MAPINLEKLMFVVASLLVLPYLLVSIRLHAQGGGVGGGASVPEDHYWRSAGKAKHHGPGKMWSGFPPDGSLVHLRAGENGGGGGVPSSRSSVVNLVPGRDAVEAWLKARRKEWPGYFNYGFVRLKPPVPVP